MTEPAVTVEQLSKSYRIGMADRKAKSVQEALRNAVLSPFRYLRYRLTRATDEDTIWALRDVSFTVGEGEVLGIIGHNGAGKSTLLKILSRITEPTFGRAKVRGHLNSLLEVGTGFHPELTGRENIFMSAALHGLRRAEIRARMDEIVEFSGVDKFLDTPVKRYSSGMYTRLAFAVAAHLDPDVMIVDEVLAVGDAEFQKKCLGKMDDAANQGRTVLFVSHNLAAVRKLCNNCLLLQNGRTVSYGPTPDVLRDYTRLIAERSGHEQNLESPPPPCEGDQTLRPLSAAVFRADGQAARQFDMDDPVVVKFRVAILDGNVDHHFYFRVLNDDDVLVFATGDWDNERWSQHQYERGEHDISITIPGHLLNAGRYHISIDGIVPNIRYLFRWHHAVSFERSPVNGIGGATSAARQGICRPAIAWDIQRIGERESRS